MICECGHNAGSHSSLKFNCLATHDGTRATRCKCRAFQAAPKNICDTCGTPYVVPENWEKHPNCPGPTISCPRKRSDMTPCVLSDGECARADDGACVGCGLSSPLSPPCPSPARPRA